MLIPITVEQVVTLVLWIAVGSLAILALAVPAILAFGILEAAWHMLRGTWYLKPRTDAPANPSTGNPAAPHTHE